MALGKIFQRVAADIQNSLSWKPFKLSYPLYENCQWFIEIELYSIHQKYGAKFMIW